MPQHHLNANGGWPALPPRHFPAFAASGRLGGGFVVEKPRTTGRSKAAATRPAQQPGSTEGKSLGPEALARAAAQSMAHAAELHAPAAAAALVTDDGRDRGLTTEIDFPTTNFHAAAAVAHSGWRHDGTDFTRGFATQQLRRRTPRRHPDGTSTSSSRHDARRPSTAPAAARPSTSDMRPEGEGDAALLQPHHTAETAAVLQHYFAAGSARGTAAADPRAGWFSMASMEQLRLDRDRAAELAALTAPAAFVPQRGAKLERRSARLAPRRLRCGSREELEEGGGGGRPTLRSTAGQQTAVGSRAATSAAATENYSPSQQSIWREQTATTKRTRATTSSSAAVLRSTGAAACGERQAPAHSALAPSDTTRRWWEDDPRLVRAVAQTMLGSDCWPQEIEVAADDLDYPPSQTLDVVRAALASSSWGVGVGAKGFGVATLLPEELCHSAWVGELAARPLVERRLQIEREVAALDNATAL
jgi:hypothetical protein